MSKDQENKANWTERMREYYKVIVYRSEDFGEVRRFDLSLGSIYVYLSVVFVSMALLFSALFLFTPIKKLIPGYGQIEANEEFLELIEQVNSLSYKVDAQETYLKGLRQLLTTPNSDVAASDEIISTAKIEPLASSIPPSPSTTDDIPRVTTPSTDEKTQLYRTMKSSQLIKPVDGVISSHFQPEISHYGIDILGPKNSPVKVMMDGYVFSSGWDLETGYTIGVQHEGNILTFYKHNSTLLKEKGSYVRAGEAIAIIGNTGTLSSGPHLHFELWHNGKAVNPAEIINF